MDLVEAVVVPYFLVPSSLGRVLGACEWVQHFLVRFLSGFGGEVQRVDLWVVNGLGGIRLGG